MHDLVLVILVATACTLILRSLGGKSMAEIKVTISLNVKPAPLVVVAPDGTKAGDGQSLQLPDAVVGQPVDVQLNVAGGVGPYSLSAAGTLPDGLTMDSTGHITGTPTAVGNGSVVLDVKDSGQ